MRQLIHLLSIIVFLSACSAKAQQTPAPATPPPDDATLEEELNQALGQPAPTPASGFISPVAPPMDSGVDEAPLITETDDDAEGAKNLVRDLEPHYSLNGWSFGVQMWNHRYNITAAIDVTSAGGITTNNLSATSADFQSIGGVLRYAILPYDSLGSDLSLTVGTSLNHGSNNFAAIYTVKAEGNLGYTLEVGSGLSAYILGGLGFEGLFGNDIENIVSRSGAGTVQVGGGIGVGKNLNAEVFYSRAFHHLSSSFIDRAGQRAKDAGATSYVGNGKFSVTEEIISGRLMYNF